MLLLIFAQDVGLTTGGMEGTAAAAFVGSSRASSVLASSGLGAFAITGRAVKPAVLSASGVAAFSAPGRAMFSSVLTAAGIGSFIGDYNSRIVTSTSIIQKPVDYALAGQQGIEKRSKLESDLGEAPRAKTKYKRVMSRGKLN